MLSAILAIAGLATVFGFLLGYASVRFKVEGDPIADQIDAILPQTQCGQCSFAGCRPYAEAIAAGEAEINRCPPGGEATMLALADLLGREPVEMSDEAAVQQVKSVALIREAECIGCTLCLQACPVDAILGAAKQMHYVIDHVIEDVDSFHRILAKGEQLARQGHLVTFGIVPTAPETGYGYIQGGEGLQEMPEAMKIARFVEKPDKATAEGYVTSGDFFWNSGMFMFQASSYLQALEQFAPEMLSATRKAYADSERDTDFIRLDKAAFEACPGDSVDYAVMERTDKGVVIPLDAGWNDVGSIPGGASRQVAQSLNPVCLVSTCILQ